MMRALPLYHWFSEDPPLEPFTKLDMTPQSTKEVIKEQEKDFNGLKLNERYF